MQISTSDPDSSAYSLQETPVLPYFKDFPVLIGQKFTFSCLGKKTYQEALQIVPELLGPMETIYIHMPEDGNPVPLTGLSLEELKSLVCSKISSESQPIISEGEFNKLRKKLSVRLTIDLKENIYSDEGPSDVSGHGGKKQPSDSEDEYQVDSGSDTTVNLNNNSGGNVFSALASGQQPRQKDQEIALIRSATRIKVQQAFSSFEAKQIFGGQAFKSSSTSSSESSDDDEPPVNSRRCSCLLFVVFYFRLHYLYLPLSLSTVCDYLYRLNF